MKLVLKYFASELNALKVKDTHSGSMFTNHMSAKLYNRRNEHVGSMITRNHHTKIADTHHITETTTVRLFGRGSMVYHLVHESPNESMQKTVRTVPHFKTDRLEKMNVVVLVDPLSAVLTIHIRRPSTTVHIDDVAEFDGQRHVLLADTVIQEGHLFSHGKLHVPPNKTLVNHGRIVSTDTLTVEGTMHNFGHHTVQNGLHVLGHYHVHNHLEVKPSTPRSLDPKTSGDNSNSTEAIVNGELTITSSGTLENSAKITVSGTGSINVEGTLVNLSKDTSIINNGLISVSKNFINFGNVTSTRDINVIGVFHNGGIFTADYDESALNYATTLINGTMYNYISYAAHTELGINAKETYTYLSPISNTTYYANGGEVFISSGAAVGTDPNIDQSFRIKGRLNNYGTVKAYYGCKIYVDGGEFKNTGTLKKGSDSLVLMNNGVYDDNGGTIINESYKYNITFDKYYLDTEELVFHLEAPKDSGLYNAGLGYKSTTVQLYTFDSDYDKNQSDNNRIGQTAEIEQQNLFYNLNAMRERYTFHFKVSKLDVDFDPNQAYRISMYNVYLTGLDGSVAAFSDFSFVANSNTGLYY
jgi:hypothetical protein